MRFGVDIVRMELNHWQPELGAGPRGYLQFGGGATAQGPTGSPNQFNSYAQFLLGLTTNVQKAVQYEIMTGREWQYGLYVRDRWQVNKDLTVNVGLRWEKYPLMTRKNRGLELYDQNTNKVLLVNFEHQPGDTPYRARHAIYVSRSSTEAFDRIDVVPEVILSRLVAVRAFDAHHMMIDADIVEGTRAAELFERLLSNPATSYLQVHNAKRGCYAARVERAP